MEWQLFPPLRKANTVWLFDLDNTLHNASARIMPRINENMTNFICRMHLNATGTEDFGYADGIRQHYWRSYGATVLGMMLHHGTSAEKFLVETHLIKGLEDMVDAERGLVKAIRSLPGRKILLTNAPRDYADVVMRHLGINKLFSGSIPIEGMWVHRRLRPKPSDLMLRRILRKLQVCPSKCVLVEDTLSNLRSGKRLGLKTVWLTQFLHAGQRHCAGNVRLSTKPAYVDTKLRSVKGLRKI